MYYALIGLITSVVLVIINSDVLMNKNKDGNEEVFTTYRLFLFSVLAYSITDALWGIFSYFNIMPLLYTDTVVYFITMAIACLSWSKYVVTYLQSKSIWGRILVLASNLFLLAEIVLVIINFFSPVLFYYNEAGEYFPSYGRYAMMGSQAIMFILTTLFTLLTMKKRKEARIRYKTIGLSGLLMAVILSAQIFFADLPLYSIGYLLGICLLRSFVIEAEKEEYRKNLIDSIEREKKQMQELGSTRRLAYTDALTGIRNKLGYIEQEDKMVAKFNRGEELAFAVAVFDLNDLKETNDTLGHEKGDEYLVEASTLMTKFFPNSKVYRIGGDEFAIILEGEDFKNRYEIVKEFNSLMEKNIKEDIHTIIALGISDFDNAYDESYESVFERADKAMYSRKEELKKFKKFYNSN